MNQPAIIFKSQFKVYNDVINMNGTKQVIIFSNFVNYMDREEAKLQSIQEKDQLEKIMMDSEYGTGKRIIDYVSNEEKTNNLFDASHTHLTDEQIKAYSTSFDIAQKNKSPMWQNIFSFDNQFLIDYGFLVDGKLDEQKIIKASQEGMKQFVNKMQFNDTVSWLGAIHYNTDNIHVHIALVEEETSREVIQTGRYKGQLKAKVPLKIMRETKSAFANSLINRTNELKRIDELSRNLITDKVASLTLGDRWRLAKELHQLLNELPENRTLWKYRNNVLKNQRPLIDNINQQLIQKYAKEDYKEFVKQVEAIDELNCRIYGDVHSGEYTNNKLDDLHARLGNHLLRTLNKQFPKKDWWNSRKQGMFYRRESHQQTTLQHLHQFNYTLSQTAKAIKRACQKSKQDLLNERKHQQLEYEKQNEQNIEYHY